MGDPRASCDWRLLTWKFLNRMKCSQELSKDFANGCLWHWIVFQHSDYWSLSNSWLITGQHVACGTTKSSSLMDRSHLCIWRMEIISRSALVGMMVSLAVNRRRHPSLWRMHPWGRNQKVTVCSSSWTKDNKLLSKLIRCRPRPCVSPTAYSLVCQCPEEPTPAPTSPFPAVVMQVHRLVRFVMMAQGDRLESNVPHGIKRSGTYSAQLGPPRWKRKGQSFTWTLFISRIHDAPKWILPDPWDLMQSMTLGKKISNLCGKIILTDQLHSSCS